MEIRIAVCDDEMQIQKQIEQYLKKYFSQVEDTATIQCFSSGEALLDIYDNQFDLLFLDIQMDQLNGIDTATRIREKDNRVCIVFITALEEYAKAGYKVKAYRYFTKPIERQVFNLEMEDIVQEVHQNKVSYITVKNDHGLFRINIQDILCVEVYNRRCYITTKNNKIESYSTLKKLESMINDSSFIRSHQSYLVNLAYVSSMEKGNTLHLVNGEVIPVSKSRRKIFTEELMKFLGSKL